MMEMIHDQILNYFNNVLMLCHARCPSLTSQEDINHREQSSVSLLFIKFLKPPFHL